MEPLLYRCALPGGRGDRSEPAAQIARCRAQDAGLEARDRGARLAGGHPGHTPRRAGDPRQGAGDEPARCQWRLGCQEPAGRALGPLQCRDTARRASAHSSAARLDRARCLALHRARGHAGGAALFRARWQALPFAGREGHHLSGTLHRHDHSRDYRRARGDAQLGARRTRHGPRKRGCLRAAARRGLYVMSTPPLKFVLAGHVDHGKSTVIGRLLHEAGALPEGKLEELKSVSERRGVPLEWSFALDSLQAERDQAVTIDTTRFALKLDGRDFVIIDAPGHREFLANMVSGASGADAAVLVLDAAEGLQEQTRRHAQLLRLIGLEQLAVAVNKLDMVDFSEARFRALEREIRDFLAGLGLTPRTVLPLSARHGDNLARASERLRWFRGPTLIEALLGFTPAAPADAAPLRLPLQDVYRQDDR